MTYQKIGFALILALACFHLYRIILRQHRMEGNHFDALDFLRGPDGKPSKAALVMYVALGTTTWIVVYQTFKSTLTDIMFGAYSAMWVAPTVASLIFNPQQKPPE